ncbi:MAG: DUF1707 SHOCT-like domain-containing protein [Streptosporangiaceae bacterium]
MAYDPGQAYPPVVPASTVLAVNPAWLAASADRERAVGVLRAGFAEGRLTQDEFTDRVAGAYAARTYSELWALTADLPSGPLPVPPGSYYGGLPWHGGYDPTIQDISRPRPWRSNAALVGTALVIFALAALVTLVLFSHGQAAHVPGGQFQEQPAVPLPYQGGQVVLEPAIKHVPGRTVIHAAPVPPSP